jgi:hypothetical protein
MERPRGSSWHIGEGKIKKHGEQGKTFTKSDPAFYAATTSVGVSA